MTASKRTISPASGRAASSIMATATSPEHQQGRSTFDAGSPPHHARDQQPGTAGRVHRLLAASAVFRGPQIHGGEPGKPLALHHYALAFHPERKWILLE